MITLARMALDHWEAGNKDEARKYIDMLPRFQLREYFPEISKICHHKLDAVDTARTYNAYHMIPLYPTDRCIQQCPKRIDAMRWLKSGGEITIFGNCCLRNCPLPIVSQETK
jgi:FMN phosphatase YigB (HAD superfamily)